MKKIDEFPDYTIHRDGRIYNKFGKLMKTWKMRGYVTVSLYHNKVQRFRRVHRLLAKAFIPNPKGYPNVLHRNDVKDDNDLDNLYWGNQSQNMLDKHRNGYISGNRKPVEQYTKDGEFVAEFPRMIDAANHIGLTLSAIGMSIKRNGHCGGYKWNYKLV